MEAISTDSVTIARGDARTIAAARAALEGRRRGVRALLAFLGPAFIASAMLVRALLESNTALTEETRRLAEQLEGLAREVLHQVRASPDHAMEAG